MEYIVWILCVVVIDQYFKIKSLQKQIMLIAYNIDRIDQTIYYK